MDEQTKLGLTATWGISGLLVALMFVLSGWMWTQLPADARVPIHWNAAGEPDGYGGKFVGLFLLPLLSVGMVVLFASLARLDPLGANIDRSRAALRATLIGLLLFLLVLHGAAMLSILGYLTNIGVVLTPALGILFMIIGNYMGKIRRNHLFGVRTPWTLSSELSWNKTHRFTGKLYFCSGVLILLASFWSPIAALITTLVMVLGSTIVALIYSYQVWKQDPIAQAAKAQ